MEQILHRFSTRVVLTLALAGLLTTVVFVQRANGMACTLSTKTAYKTAASPSVYYISTDCKKRPIRNPDVFFSHFDSWSAVRVTSEASLNRIPEHELSFLPWGPRRDFQDGSLVKTVSDPKVYLKVGNSIHPIGSEGAFRGLGYDFSWIEDVSADVIAKYQRAQGITGPTDVPNAVVFKYPGDPKVYLLENQNGQRVRRHIQSLTELRRRYRADRIVTLPVTRIFSDGTPVRETTPAPAPAPSAPPPATTPRTPNTNRGAAGSTDVNARHTPGRLSFNGLPPAGQVFQDPVFGTDMMRFTDAIDRGDYANHTYSQLQAFSHNSDYLLVDEAAGSVVRKLSDRSMAPIGPITGVSTLRWWPGHENKLFYFDTDDSGRVRARAAHILTGQRDTLYTFPATYSRIFSNQSFDELSDDGRWVGGMIASGDDAVLFAVDLVNKRQTVALSVSGLYNSVCQEDPQYGQIDPDWVSASPLGNYLVVNWARDGAQRCSGQEVYDINTGRYLGHSYDGRQHGDLAVTTAGEEVFFTDVPNPDNNGLPALGYYRLPDGVNSPVYLRTIPWHGIWHVSCRGPRGMCLVTSFDSESGWDLRQVLESELYMIYLSDGSVRRLAHHRSSGCGYWVQPRATLSLDARYAAFDTDFWAHTGGRTSCQRNDLDDPSLGGGEVFLLLLPDAVKQPAGNARSFEGF